MAEYIEKQSVITALEKHWNGMVLDGFDFIRNLPSADVPHWIPCSERLPEDFEEVNVTWVNHDPEPYYDFTKDVPFTATAVCLKGKWYWYSSTCTDILAEYGNNHSDEMDSAIEVIAWMPLPEPYKAKSEEV